MKNSRRRLQELLGAGDFPAEILTGVPVIEIKGDTETVVINHRGILSYQEDAVRIASGLGPICIRGKDLVIYPEPVASIARFFFSPFLSAASSVISALY